ncbi:hypothetical protein K7J14_13870 [Treponema zuelzerae]|uniref:Uncharacterized protein n=1 Tax=Teretinema zuelzerae TaxID=156 RepID=A0AAE3JL10_9SPIR|nr:hypothetical protein [Teretinema zuelzerae]MCD1655780.1 hypothetical protein [Teretinema zuelzerae]
MMKKLIGAMLGAALVFGAASCDNSLNDKEEPKEGVALEIADGFWWNTTIDVSSRGESEIFLTISSSGNPQYPAFGENMSAYNAEGVVYYEWDSANSLFQQSQRTDNPAAESEAGKLKIFIYSQANPVHVWAFLEDETNLTGGTWPGVAMESAAPALETITITGITVRNASDYEDEILYVLEAWLPDNAWGIDTPNTITVDNGTGTRTFATAAEIDGETIAIQMINDDGLAEDGVTAEAITAETFWAEPHKAWANTVTVTNPRDGESYVLVADFSTGLLTLE